MIMTDCSGCQRDGCVETGGNERMKKFVIKGDICYSETSDKLYTAKDSYAVCEDGICAGVYQKLPERYEAFPCYDYTGHLVIPGLTDLHVHAPQYPFRGLGMDLELIDWLNTHTFVEEAKYAELSYAEKAYEIFTEDLRNSATARACIFGTIHTKATLLLMEKLEESGIIAYAGRVNMDRNSPENLCEKDAVTAARDTEEWILECGRFQNVRPMLTPRFIPVCSDALMEELSRLQKKYHLPLQSHLSENLGEIEWVKELCPDAAFYGAAYDKYGLFGNDCPTIMAHCVHSSEDEIRMMKEQNVFVAHCPESNTNLSSGIAPVRKYLELGVHAGLGSDIAAGSGLSIFKSMAMAVQCSKLRWRLTDQSLAPLRIEEAFYLGTKGGGAFFGKAGSFEKGYEFDAIVLDESSLRHPQELDIKERLERFIYLADDRCIAAKFVGGVRLFEKNQQHVF